MLASKLFDNPFEGLLDWLNTLPNTGKLKGMGFRLVPFEQRIEFRCAGCDIRAEWVFLVGSTKYKDEYCPCCSSLLQHLDRLERSIQPLRPVEPFRSAVFRGQTLLRVPFDW
jgi:hypothetical protein